MSESKTRGTYGRRPVTNVDIEAKRGTCPTHGPDSRLRVRTRESGKVYVTCRHCDRGQNERRNTSRKVPIAPEAARRHRLMTKYGLTVEEFQLRIEGQQNLCLICCDELTQPVVDHDHDRGHVRGILCRNCNLGLGFFRDSPESLRRAIRYVRRNRQAAG